VALLYAVAALAWIVGTDLLVGAFTSDIGVATALSMAKGALFVAVSAALLYFFILRAGDLFIWAQGEPGRAPAAARRGLHTPILIFGILALALVASAVTISTLRAQSRIRTAADEVAAIGELKAQDLESWLAMQSGIALSFRTARSMVEDLKALARQGDSRIEASLRARLGQVREATHASTIEAIAPDGRTLINNGRDVTVSPWLRGRIADAIRLDAPQLNLLHRDPDSEGGAIHLDYLIPLRASPQDGAVAGLLLLRHDPAAYLFPRLQVWPGSRHTAEVALARRDGDHVLVLNELRNVAGAAFRFRLPLESDVYPLARIVRDGVKAIRGPDYRGKDVLAYGRGIKGTDWYLEAKEDSAEVLAEVIRDAAATAAVIVLATLLGGIATVVMWHQQAQLAGMRERTLAAERDALGKHLQLLSRHANDIMLLFDGEGRIVQANDRAFEAYGRDRDELIGQHGALLRAPGESGQFRENFARTLREGRLVFESAHMRRNGERFPVEVSARRIDVDGRQFIQSVVRDISERKQSEARVAHLMKLLDALSAVNRAIVHATTEGALFGEVCRVAVKRAGFMMALVGVIDSKTGLVRVVADAGGPSGFAEHVDVTNREAPDDRRPIRAAIRAGRPLVYQDIRQLKDQIWTEYALAHGILSLAALPIRASGNVIGAILVYSSKADQFDSETLALLEEMAGDVSFSLDVLAHDRELHESEARFRAVLEQSIAGIYVIQNGKFAYVNPRFAEIFRYDSTAELTGREFSDLVSEAHRDLVAENIRRRIAGETDTVSYEFEGRRKDGSTLQVGVHGTRATYGGRPAVIGAIQDISEKKRAEEEIQRYIERLQEAVQSTIEVVSTIGEMRDPYTHGHERRVGELAARIAEEMGFDRNRVEGVRVAGYVHDVGKIGVPAEILAKPSRLSKAEFDLVKQHSQQSYEILKGVDFPWPVAEASWQHHERLDGSGYPQGLKGEAIILEARILAVADVIEAMSSHRPYRPGLGIEAALAEIEKNRGKLYDPQPADACLRLFREKGYILPA